MTGDYELGIQHFNTENSQSGRDESELDQTGKETNNFCVERIQGDGVSSVGVDRRLE
jgi:hypothetical protein